MQSTRLHMFTHAYVGCGTDSRTAYLAQARAQRYGALQIVQAGFV